MGPVMCLYKSLYKCISHDKNSLVILLPPILIMAHSLTHLSHLEIHNNCKLALYRLILTFLLLYGMCLSLGPTTLLTIWVSVLPISLWLSVVAITKSTAEAFHRPTWWQAMDGVQGEFLVLSLYLGSFFILIVSELFAAFFIHQILVL